MCKIELISQVQKYAKQDAGETVKDVKRHVGSRNVGVGSQILANLGVGKMRLLSSQTKYHSLSGFGLEITEFISYKGCCGLHDCYTTLQYFTAYIFSFLTPYLQQTLRGAH